ncbi:hypothetical protein RUM43_006382 [Polyplax serrata]|uniref:Uncharacterized protein n=1 Tax=Polyplax serrata TaxID=468196 RepID=A0AAN8S247_POLSC
MCTFSPHSNDFPFGRVDYTEDKLDENKAVKNNALEKLSGETKKLKMSCDEVEKRCRPLRVRKKYMYEEALQMAVGYVTDTFNTNETKAIVNLNGANGDSKTKTATKTKKKGK